MPLLDSVERRVLVASAAVGSVGYASIFAQPLLIAEILASRGLTEASAGFVLTVEMLAVALSSVSCTRLCRGKSFLAIGLIGAIVAALGNWAAWVSTGYGALLAIRVLCGLGEGAALFVASAAPARFANPDRTYAKINTITILFGTLLIYVAPFVGRITGGAMIFPTMLLAFIALLPAVLLMPRGERFAHAQTSSTAPQGKPPSVTLVVIWSSFFIFVTMNSAVFSFCAILGERAGMTAVGVNSAIAVATLSSLIGSGLAGLIGTRFGRLLPMLSSIVLVTIALFFLSNARLPVTFWWTTNLQIIGDYFSLPYFQGSAAEEDPSGRGVAFVNATIPLSYALGPFVGGVVAEQYGFASLGWAAVAVNAIVFGMVVFLHPGVVNGLRRAAGRVAS
jgi:predicted MFS family arabinose efflux permease